MKKLSLSIVIFLIFSCIYAIEFMQNFDYNYQMQTARDLHRHGYYAQALELFIKIHNYERTPEKLKAESMYMMGEISFIKGDFNTAIEDWEILYNLFPDSELTDKVLERLAEIRTTIKKRKEALLTPIEIANDYYRHNFSEIAKQKFLEIYHNIDSSDEEKAEALYLVGQISFEEGNYDLALDDWEILITKFPQSEQTQAIVGRLSQFKEIITEDSEGTVMSVLAKSYLQNGDFWTNAKHKFIIDSSWLPNLEIAIQWYDRIIEEFPRSSSSEVAYRRKLFTVLGNSGKDGNPPTGVKADYTKYMPQVLLTFNQFENDHPDSGYLQGFRYQIAQIYWSRGNWQKAKDWLNKIIVAGEGKYTFYTETAKARLKKLEY